MYNYICNDKLQFKTKGDLLCGQSQQLLKCVSVSKLQCMFVTSNKNGEK